MGNLFQVDHAGMNEGGFYGNSSGKPNEEMSHFYFLDRIYGIAQ